VVGSAVISDRSGCRSATEWSQKLLQTIPDSVSGTLLGVPTPGRPSGRQARALPQDRRDRGRHGNRISSPPSVWRTKLPVAAIRVITDPAKRALPASAVAAMRPNGTTNIGAMLRSVLKRPRELPALFQTALDARAARATLVRGRYLLGPAFTLPATA